jgi:hypothetical protein
MPFQFLRAADVAIRCPVNPIQSPVSSIQDPVAASRCAVNSIQCPGDSVELAVAAIQCAVGGVLDAVRGGPAAGTGIQIQVGLRWGTGNTEQELPTATRLPYVIFCYAITERHGADASVVPDSPPNPLPSQTVGSVIAIILRSKGGASVTTWGQRQHAAAPSSANQRQSSRMEQGGRSETTGSRPATTFSTR